jgi:CoA-transferase family III
MSGAASESVGDDGRAEHYRARVKADLGVRAPPRGEAGEHPAVSWRRSGLDQATGYPDGPPLMAPASLTACAEGVLAALRDLAPAGALAGWNGAALMGERARLLGLRRGGQISPGGACKLLPARDGWIAISLARADDWAAMNAWLEVGDADDWDAVTAAVRARAADHLVARGRLLGVAVARHQPEASRPWLTRRREGPAAAPRERPLVLDLSSLWAGPLCGSLLAGLGARVLKIESPSRPDGARGGEASFYDLLNWDKESVALDLRQPDGVAALRALIKRADIVIESARPRGLAQLGISAEACMRDRAGLVWVSITGHGRDGEAGEWVGFGDECGVEAGLSWRMAEAHGAPLFCGDALADPLTGLHAALAAWASWRAGGGEMLALSLSGVVSHALAQDPVLDFAARVRAWSEIGHGHALYPPRRAPRAAPLLGADTARVLAEM